jgi:hypothetical protein
MLYPNIHHFIRQYPHFSPMQSYHQSPFLNPYSSQPFPPIYHPYPSPYPKPFPYMKPQPSGIQYLMNSFKNKDGNLDLNKMFDTAGQVMNTMNQMGSLFKGMTQMFKA